MISRCASYRGDDLRITRTEGCVVDATQDPLIPEKVYSMAHSRVQVVFWVAGLAPSYLAASQAMLNPAEMISVVCIICTTERISTVCNITQRWSRRCATYHGDDLRGVQHTAEMISAVCNIPQRWSPWCATYRGEYLRSVHHTAEMIYVHTT